MLRKLTVRNFALIRDLVFEPSAGLNVITGETGAGKSILLGALGLVLGNRADHSALMNNEQKCVIEAEFDIDEYKLQAFFEENDLDYGSPCIMRREISAQGKSRAFINDTPASLSQLKELGNFLVEVHTQNTGLLITEHSAQLEVLDDYAGSGPLLKSYRNAFAEWRNALAALDHLKQEQARLEKDKDYLQFQFDELSEFAPRAGEEALMDQDIERLSHAGDIAEQTLATHFELLESEDALLGKMGTLKAGLRTAAHAHPGVQALVQRMDSVLMDLREIALELREIGEKSEGDPQRLEELNARHARLQLLLKKHNAAGAEELLNILDGISDELLKTHNSGEALAAAEKHCAACRVALDKVGLELHGLRASVCEKLATEACALLHELEIPGAALKLNLDYHPTTPGTAGADTLQMLFTANAGQPLQPMEKAASGGEVSRLNFCFKSLLAGRKSMPSLVFDEADTGVSGHVAGRMGEMMEALGRRHQLISITHLPQVAAKGQTHFFVYKDPGLLGTESKLRRLEPEERISVIAQMLSGKSPGKAAMENARELLN